MRDLVDRLAVSRSTVMALLASGEIASLTIRRSRRVRLSDLVAYIEAQAAVDSTRRTKKAVSDFDPETAKEAGRDATTPASG